MPDGDDRRSSPSSSSSIEGRLDSWKEIAAYLGRGVRTVQRWEREEGLPVHRLAHDKRGTIYARREELAAWWESRRLALTAPSRDDARADTHAAPAPPRLERVTRTSAMTVRSTDCENRDRVMTRTRTGPAASARTSASRASYESSSPHAFESTSAGIEAN